MARPRLAPAACALAAAALLLPGGAAAQTLADPDLVVETFAQGGLALPTGFQFLGPDDAFVIEKNSGRVKRVQGGVASEVLDLDVSTDSERGLLGIELHPDFSENGWVYLYWSERSVAGDGSGSWAGNRLARFEWDGSTLTRDAGFSEYFVPFRAGEANGPNHDGGPLRFGPDGRLYLQTGDLNRSHAEQNAFSDPLTSADAGGIHRFEDDGTIPADNPFVSNPNADFHSLYAYGVRNGFGMAWDPETGLLWDTENGPNRMDEINLVEPGFNSGWTILMGPTALDPQGQDEDDLVSLGAAAAYSEPEFSFADTIGITALEFLSGSALGAAYDDKLLVGDANTGQLYLFELNAGRDGFELLGNLADLVADTGVERSQLVFGQGFGTVTDMQLGPDGALYVASISFGAGFNGIRRIALIPEPGTFATLALGLAVLGARRRARAEA